MGGEGVNWFRGDQRLDKGIEIVKGLKVVGGEGGI